MDKDGLNSNLKRLFLRYKELFVYSVAFFFVFVFDFGLNSILSFKVDTTTYLLYQNILNTTPFLTALVGFGLPFSITFLSAKGEKLKNKKNVLYESDNFVVKMFLMLLLPVLLLCFITGENWYVLIALGMSFSLAIKQNVLAYYLGGKELYKVSIIRILPKVIFFIAVLLIVFLIQLDQKIFGVFLIIAELLGVLYLHKKYSIFKFKAPVLFIKRIRKYSKYALVANGTYMGALAFPVMYMNHLNFTDKTIVQYSIAYSLIKYFTLILAPFMQLIVPYFSIVSSKKRLVAMFNKYTTIILFVGIVVALVSYFFTNIIITKFFSEKYIGAVPLFEQFCYVIPIMFLTSFTSTVISAIGRVNLTAKIQVWALFLMLFLGGVLIFKYNVIGALYTVLFYELFKVLANVVVFYKRMYVS